MPLAVLTPFDRSPARSAGGRIWWKRVLPIGNVEYEGRTLRFTRPYLDSLARAFRDRAYDQVPFQLATDENKHTNNPERFRGDVLDFDVRGNGNDPENDGLWVAVRPTADGERILRENPNLGVSARIIEQYERSDGKQYPVAMQHVLGTLDPRIPGLGPWQAVDMSNDGVDQVVDLSAEDYQLSGEDEGEVALNAAEQRRIDQLLALPDDQFNALIDAFVASDEGTEGGADDDLTDEELNEILAEVDAEGVEALESRFQQSLAGAGSSLSNGYAPGTLDLANIQLAEQQRQLGIMQDKMDRDAFEHEKAKMARAGIPPYIVDMARPLLEGAGHVVEMSNGTGVDAGLVMRRVLTEYSRAVQLLDLSTELGTTMDEPDDSLTATQARDELMIRYKNQVGLH